MRGDRSPTEFAMSEAAEKLLAQALTLSVAERLELIDRLQQSLDEIPRDPNSVKTTTEIKAADVIARLQKRDQPKQS
jgi:hypothetical protein